MKEQSQPSCCRRLLTKLGEDVAEFAEHTSAHGLPRAYVSRGLRRALWLLLFFACLCVFGYQAYLIMDRFSRNDIIVGVELKFEAMRFPAVTLCNINAYKNSPSRQFSSVKSAIEAFEFALDSQSPRKKRSIDNLMDVDISDIQSVRLKCSLNPDGLYRPDLEGGQDCTCTTFGHFDEDYDDVLSAWNCAPRQLWVEKVCVFSKIDKSGREIKILSGCLCIVGDNYCVKDVEFKKIVARWPLVVNLKKNHSLGDNSYDVCFQVKEDLRNEGIAYCKSLDYWKISRCSSCDWWARCSISTSDYDKDQCLCSNNMCFAIENPNNKDSIKKRSRRDFSKTNEQLFNHYEGLLAVNSTCTCTASSGCTALRDYNPSNSSTCVCFYNKKNDNLWPCYENQHWQIRKCRKCSTFGDCIFDERQRGKHDCFCAVPIKMCVRIDAIESNATLIEQLPAIWEIPKTTPASIVEKKRADTEKAYGYKGVKDPIALKAKAMENIIFAVDQLTADQKYTITYNRSEFIIKCSFNQEECDLENDFVTYLDPTFGACFTYHSANESRSISSGRAGPNYGLRIEVLVNITEYLPTTEAAGVRLTVHSHDEQPFPDTHGFSAPTGFVSSFGIKLQSITRLPAPYGDCVEDGKDEKFIYTDKAYSTEGCQRSCIQKYLFDNCGCGDPRYPPYKTNRNCPVDDPNKRSCINRQFLNATKQSTSKDCTCKQPCRETVYSVSYSAARWPAVPADLSGCPIGLSPQHCLLYKREQGAMVEVYFEKLNYESLLEREAFGWSNLLSDFGGQLGLWMGVSVISVMEVLIFFCDLIFTFLGIKRHKQKTNKLNNRRASLRNSIRNKTDSNKVNNNVDYDSMLENHDHQH